MQRVAIIGCPGSGKTTFAQEFAQKTSLPLIHLDLYYHDKRYSYKQNKQAWRQLVQGLISQEEWIIDGNYKSTFDVRLSRADTIIFLDYPRCIVLWRMLKRRIKYRNKLREDMPEGWQEKISPEFLKFVRTFNSVVRPEIYDMLEKHGPNKTIVIFKKPSEADKYLKNCT